MIQIVCNYPYDNHYDYTKAFQTQTERRNYFNTLHSITEDEYVANEYEHGYIKETESFCVEYNYDYLVSEGANYLIFNNGFKDIYAFIVRKEYVTDDTTRLHYEIDVIQTYYFDIIIQNSFIERKVCSIGEIANFDEGLYLGEHQVELDTTVINKEYQYFGMFNGIKEQAVTFDSQGKFANVVDMPYVTAKPMTIIDGVQYPLFFLPLQESYADVEIVPINPNIVITSGVVGSARKLLGKPYIYGGNYPPLGDSLGTDCSGLIMWAYNDQNLLPQTGISGRWTTYTMYAKTGVGVDIRDAKPGDVIYMNFSAPGRPEHVVLISNININRITIIEAPQRDYDIVEYTIDYNPNLHKIGRIL